MSPGGSGTAPDGVSGREGTFNMCSFWLVDAFTGAGRPDLARLEDARLLFDTCALRSHTGKTRRSLSHH